MKNSSTPQHASWFRRSAGAAALWLLAAGAAYPAVPNAVNNLTATINTVNNTDGQVYLAWTTANNTNSAANPVFDVRYTTAGSITTDALFNAATPATGEPAANVGNGTARSMTLTGLSPDLTYYYAIKATNASGTSALDTSAPRPNAIALAFDATQIEVGGAANAGLLDGDVAWGDLDGDGLMDVVAEGTDSGATRRLRIYRNTGGGTFAAALNLAGLAGGNLALGDFNGDGKLDILASGNDAGGRQLKVFVNQSTVGTLSFPTTIDVPSAANLGFDNGCGVAWADLDNDGDMDVVACGDQGVTPNARLHVYYNFGNTAVAPNYFSAALDLTAASGFYHRGGIAVADFNHDGRLDIAASGYNTTEAGRQLAVYTNNGVSSFTQTIIAGGLSTAGIAAGDMNNDGWMDLIIMGWDGGQRQLRYFRNNSGVFNIAATDVPGAANVGLNRGQVSVTDFDLDGDQDIIINGFDGTDPHLRFYRGNGAGGFSGPTYVEAVNGGLYNLGGLALGDFDQDGDVDVAISGTDVGGNPQLRVYKSLYSLARVNAAPNAPTGLASAFSYSSVGTSTATFKWLPATDNAPGATPSINLMYEVQVATNSGFTAPLVMNLSDPQSFPLIYDGNIRYGTFMTSTNPWTAPPALYGLQTDTTYYFQVRTVDGNLAVSPWSASGLLWTGVAPSTSAVSVASVIPSTVTLSWLSAGNDDVQGVLSGNYRIQYSTNPAAAWSATSTPALAFTTTISTNSQTHASTETVVVGGLTQGSSYYFRLWTQDDANLWSAISAQTTAYVPVAVRDVVLSTGAYDFGNVAVGLSTQTTAAITVTYTGNISSTFVLSASTITAGSPWTLGATPAADRAVVYAGFNATMPALASFVAGDVLTNFSQGCAAGVFSLGQSCVNVPAASTRILWFRVDMPTSSSASTQQQIQVTVTAGP